MSVDTILTYNGNITINNFLNSLAGTFLIKENRYPSRNKIAFPDLVCFQEVAMQDIRFSKIAIPEECFKKLKLSDRFPFIPKSYIKCQFINLHRYRYNDFKKGTPLRQDNNLFNKWKNYFSIINNITEDSFPIYEHPLLKNHNMIFNMNAGQIIRYSMKKENDEYAFRVFSEHHTNKKWINPVNKNMAMFVNKKFNIDKILIFVVGMRSILAVEINSILYLNLHLISKGGGKGKPNKALFDLHILIRYLNKMKQKYMLIGDFNIDVKTELILYRTGNLNRIIPDVNTHGAKKLDFILSNLKLKYNTCVLNYVNAWKFDHYPVFFYNKNTGYSCVLQNNNTYKIKYGKETIADDDEKNDVVDGTVVDAVDDAVIDKEDDEEDDEVDETFIDNKIIDLLYREIDNDIEKGIVSYIGLRYVLKKQDDKENKENINPNMQPSRPNKRRGKKQKPVDRRRKQDKHTPRRRQGIIEMR